MGRDRDQGGKNLMKRGKKWGGDVEKATENQERLVDRVDPITMSLKRRLECKGRERRRMLVK